MVRPQCAPNPDPVVRAGLCYVVAMLIDVDIIFWACKCFTTSIFIALWGSGWYWRPSIQMRKLR